MCIGWSGKIWSGPPHPLSLLTSISLPNLKLVLAGPSMLKSELCSDLPFHHSESFIIPS